MVKLSMAVGVLLLGISSCYYFVFALPKLQNQRLVAQVSATNWDHERQCSAAAEHFFNESGWSDKNSGAWYENHFNRRLNRCFILVRSNISEGQNLVQSTALMDVNDGESIGQYGKNIPFGKADYAVKPFTCDVLDKYCQTTEEFDAFVKPYMED